MKHKKIDNITYIIYRVLRYLLLGGYRKNTNSTVIKFSGIVVSTVADLLGLLLESFEHFPTFT